MKACGQVTLAHTVLVILGFVCSTSCINDAPNKWSKTMWCARYKTVNIVNTQKDKLPKVQSPFAAVLIQSN